VGSAVLVFSLGLIWRWGDLKERRLGLWALTLNILPFFLVSLARYQRGLNQPFAPRYAVYTLMGALILLGTAWGILKRRLPPGPGMRLLPLALVAVMAAGQVLSLPAWEKLYGGMSRASRDFYQGLDISGEPDKGVQAGTPAPTGTPALLVPPQFWYPERLQLTWGQAVGIRKLLRGASEGGKGQ
jgi:hypothetical protein